MATRSITGTTFYLVAETSSDESKEKIDKLQRMLADIPFSQIAYSSKSPSTSETALQLLNGKEVSILSIDPLCDPCPDETLQEVHKRILDLLFAAGKKDKGKPILFVTHVAALRIFLGVQFGRNPEAIQIGEASLAIFHKREQPFTFQNSGRKWPFSFEGGEGLSMQKRLPSETLFAPSLFSPVPVPGWGGLRNPALQERFSVLAAKHFSSKLEDGEEKELQKLYESVIGPEEKVKGKALKEIQQKTLEDIAAKICSGRGETYSKLIQVWLDPEGPFVNQFLLHCYEYGEAELLYEYLSLYNSNAFKKAWVQKIEDDFHQGLPLSFSMIANLIFFDKGSINLVPNDPEKTLSILEKLASLGITPTKRNLVGASEEALKIIFPILQNFTRSH